ncbi:MAG: thiamine pyrophosphate-dependent dehydrogenase E1 component subunit alpha [Pseudomonadota bacterium]
MKLKNTDLIHLYKTMLTIRRFEERVVDMFARGQVPGLTHAYIGEEAIAAGVCAALRKDDYITSTHRGHGHVIARGADLKRMMAELCGKKTGYCKGKGGSMHIADMSLGILGANGIVGGGLPITVGAALTAKRRGTDQVAVSFFGDAASNTGSFHESLNLASVWKLPVLFVCENNLYGISVSQEKHQAIKDIADRAAAYGMAGALVDGMDVIAVHQATVDAVNRARSGQGPTLLECKTYRYRGHHEGDPNMGARYRTKQEIEAWKKKDPIDRMAGLLVNRKVVTKKKLAEINKALTEQIEGAVAFALESPFPEAKELYEDLYV